MEVNSVNISKMLPLQGIRQIQYGHHLWGQMQKNDNEPLAIPFLGTDTTPIISGKDPISKLLITKAHLRNMHSCFHPIHETASTTLSRLMTGRYGGLTLKCGGIQNRSY